VTYYAHTLVWPLLTGLIAVALLVCLYSLAKRLRPRVEWHRLLFDRKQVTRHPFRFVIAWMSVLGAWFAAIALILVVADNVGSRVPMEEGGHHQHHVGH